MKKVFGTLEYKCDGAQLKKVFCGIDEEEVIAEMIEFAEDNLLGAIKITLKIEESTETRVGMFVDWKDDNFIEFIVRQDKDFAEQVKMARKNAKEVDWHIVHDTETEEWLLRLGRYWYEYQTEQQLQD